MQSHGLFREPRTGLWQSLFALRARAAVRPVRGDFCAIRRLGPASGVLIDRAAGLAPALGVLRGTAGPLRVRGATIRATGCAGATADSLRAVHAQRVHRQARRGAYFCALIDQYTYHLELLHVEEAAKAIKHPAKEFGYGYAPECYEQIIRDLKKEDRYVEPTHLQVVCERLWSAKGEELAHAVESEPVGALPLVPLDVYVKENGVRGIMSAFLWGYLNGLDERRRLETVEIFEQLITPSGTRNIVEYDYLVNAPFRNADRRAELLAQLVNRTIVRAETRLGGQFVEITHEFLIAPIKEAIQQIMFATPGQKRFALALDALERVREMGTDRGTKPSLMDWEFDALDRKAGEVEWPAWAVETMFRNAISHEAQPEVIRQWADRLASQPAEGHG